MTVPAATSTLADGDSPPNLRDDASDRILSTRRSAQAMALTVFVTTTIQVLAQPLAVLIEGRVEWTLVLPPPLLPLTLLLGCAVQGASFLLSERWPEGTVLLTTAIYIGLAVGLAVPSWLIGMYLVIALALFLLATRRRLTVSIVWLAGVVIVTVAVLFFWTLAMGLTFSVAMSFVTAEAIRIAAPAIAGTALGAVANADAPCELRSHPGRDRRA